MAYTREPRFGPMQRAPRRPHATMSPMQLQAYLLARETLRRLKSTPTPCVPRDVRRAPRSAG